MNILLYFLIVYIDVFCVLWYDEVSLLLLKILDFLIHCVVVLNDVDLSFDYAFLKLLKVKTFICSNCGSDLAQDGGNQGFNFDFFDIPSRQKLLEKIQNDE